MQVKAHDGDRACIWVSRNQCLLTPQPFQLGVGLIGRVLSLGLTPWWQASRPACPRQRLGETRECRPHVACQPKEFCSRTSDCARCSRTLDYARSGRFFHEFGTPNCLCLGHSEGLAEELVDAVRDARAVCTFYGTSRGCRKGAKCPLRHVDSEASDRRLPLVTRAITREGKEIYTLRPPLTHAVIAKRCRDKAEVTVLASLRQVCFWCFRPYRSRNLGSGLWCLQSVELHVMLGVT